MYIYLHLQFNQMYELSVYLYEGCLLVNELKNSKLLKPLFQRKNQVYTQPLLKIGKDNARFDFAVAIQFFLAFRGQF